MMISVASFIQIVPL